MSKPLVSVVIPTIDSRKEYLKKAVQSVHDQTYKNLELIIIRGNLGGQQARNEGIRKAKGKYIAFLDDDDTWFPTKIEKQVAAMEKDPSASICITWMNDYRSGSLYVNKPKEKIYHTDLLEGWCLSSTSSYLCRASHLGFLWMIDGYVFNPKYISGQEYNVAIRITNWSHVICVQEVLTNQFRSVGQISNDWKKKIRGKFIMVEDMKHELGWRRSIKHLGVIPLFFLGYFLGDKQREIVNWLKEVRHGKW